MSFALQRSGTDKDHELVAAKAAATIAEGKLSSLLEELSNAKHTSEAASTTSGLVLKVGVYEVQQMHVPPASGSGCVTAFVRMYCLMLLFYAFCAAAACCWPCAAHQALTKQVTDTVTLQAEIEAQQSTIGNLQAELSQLAQLHASKEELVSTLQDGSSRLREQLELEQALRKQADKASEVSLFATSSWASHHIGAQVPAASQTVRGTSKCTATQQTHVCVNQHNTHVCCRCCCCRPMRRLLMRSTASSVSWCTCGTGRRS
jgi:hypothetical protein